MSESRDKAVHLLQHYFRLVGQSGGQMKWNSDLDAEVEGIVDHVIDATVERVMIELAELAKPASKKAKRK